MSEEETPEAKGSSGSDPDKAARIAEETGITEEQAEQLQRAAADEDELDSAAEAAARWS